MTLPQLPVETPPPTRKRPRRRRLLGAAALVLTALAGYAVWSNTVPYVLRSAITIDATPEQVWSVLTDLPAYEEWNPFIVSSSGTVAVGATLTNTMRDATGEMTFTPTLLAVTPGRELRWLGKLGPGGVFDGEHAFLIEPVDGGRVRLSQTETFSGVAVPFFRGRLHDQTLPQFRAMNDALARRVTSLSTP
ncbi:SRPBCC domain-containing protein [Actinoplanes sp. ATCC 53533]|uniref:SRPBCC domain-containing protein n=1 Tax=Actinoplanes sp. ATCC 53533 TaxID=1288362 RepID=UPI000F799D54|nr:SRPBCC domain-containing protein [Actinoplanes sp. ATCC 53533]RSM74895.1 SRPBCC domain-containing protein [Actinoplanes sp. ATCC 53533]